MLGLMVICQIIMPQGERWHGIGFVDGINVLMAFELVNFKFTNPAADSRSRVIQNKESNVPLTIS